MSLFNKDAKQNTGNSNSGGNANPAHNIIVKYKSHEMVGSKLVFNVEMISNEFEDFPAGTETTVSITDENRAKKVADYLKEYPETYSEGSTFAMNSARVQNGEISAYAFSRLTPTADPEGYEVELNQFVEATPVREINGNKFQEFKNYKVDKALTVVGKNESNPFEGTMYDEMMSDHMDDYKGSSNLEKLAYIVEVLRNDPEMEKYKKFDLVFRAYGLNPGEDAENGLLDASNTDVVTLPGTIPDNSGEYTVHKSASLQDLIDFHVNNFDATQIKNERYRQAVEDKMVALQNMLNNLDDLSSNDFFIEVLPVGHMNSGAAVKKESEQKIAGRNRGAQPFNPKMPSVNRNTGENYTRPVILSGTTLVTREAKNTEKHFVSDCVSNIVMYGDNAGYKSDSVRNKKNLVTRNAELYPELVEAMEKSASDSVAYFDKRKWNTSNDNSSGEPDHDAEAEGPDYDTPGGP